MKRAAKGAGLRLRSVYFAHPMGRPQPNARIFADVSGRAYEFVRLTATAQIEAYDYPKTWGGVPRFVGYLPDEQATRLMAIARAEVKRRLGWLDTGRTIEMGGA